MNNVDEAALSAAVKDGAENAVLAAARAYVAAGFSVLPVVGNGKKPATWALPTGDDGKPTWKPYQTRHPSGDELARWFERGRCGIGLIAGAVSGHLEILDFDEPGVCDEFLAACRENGLGKMVEAMPLDATPRGGRHLYFRVTGPVDGSMKLAMTADGKKVRIESRGEGGYAVVPPSPEAAHRCGKAYRLLHGDFAAMPVLTEEERLAILAVATSFHLHREEEPAPVRVSEPRPDTAPAERRPRADGDPLRPGDDFIERGDVEALLIEADWVKVHTAGEMSFWRRPGKDRGISATLNYGGHGCFYAFSTSAHPFETNRPYNPFAVYAVLKHQGDYGAAAGALRIEGYGGPLPEAADPKAGKADKRVKQRALTAVEQRRVIEEKMARVAKLARRMNAAAFGVEHEDLVGEAFLHLVEAVRAYRQARGPLDEIRLKDHIDRHVRNRLYDAWDAVKAKKRQPGSSLPLPELSTAGLLPGSSCKDHLADRLLLHSALARLPKLEFNVITMDFFGGYSDAEIAEALGVAVRSVRYRRQKALAQLHKDLA